MLSSVKRVIRLKFNFINFILFVSCHDFNAYFYFFFFFIFFLCHLPSYICAYCGKPAALSHLHASTASISEKILRKKKTKNVIKLRYIVKILSDHK